jgi:CTP synthase (UTP-ammonia lyase)
MLVLNDFNTTVEKALSEIDPKWRNYKGLIVCGTHTPHHTESMIYEIRIARVNGSPFLGICFGHQLAAIEYARNVLGIENATSQEFGKGNFVVRKRKELKVGLHDGETYWSNYDVDQDIVDKWVKADNFITIPFHPEYQSSKDNPHPVLVEFLNHCKHYEMEV